MNAKNAYSNARRYWETTAEQWNEQYYGDQHHERSWLSRLTRNPPEVAHFRKQIVLDHLETHIKDKRVVEFGCGIGLLSQGIIERGARVYHGYDIAQKAIDIALEKVETSEFSGQITFSRAALEDIKTVNADFVISVGLTTWINTDQIDHMFAMCRGIDFLHTISAPQFNFRYILRVLHQNLAPAQPYQGQPKKMSKILDIAKQHGWDNLHVYRHRKLNSIACLSSVPFSERLGLDFDK